MEPYALPRKALSLATSLWLLFAGAPSADGALEPPARGTFSTSKNFGRTASAISAVFTSSVALAAVPLAVAEHTPQQGAALRGGQKLHGARLEIGPSTGSLTGT